MTSTPSAPVIDTTTDFGKRVAERLQQDTVIWLTTVGPSGTPQPNPVWFLWDGTEFLLFSKPNQSKLRNIEHNSRISLNFNSTASGGDVVVLTGTARIDDNWPSADEIATYTKKYAEGLARIGMTAEDFYHTYSVPVRITPDRLRGF